ncbi:energy-coupling factor ABC transporter ATP-binding protein [Brochothrix campestris]|uniref:Cobalt transport ATP-binding protein n=1 Tax=Brochothrix campestris FSL F6-1037 TaxID=1265861 RepID=W7CV68_9LIST|nr:energy-coupling factor ABC transporter ATP-binding protein [Brochothrix campestris]EUJ40802.1 cobalt transport ATP-binding protein [Brochothrix campestris FSL F6-1037]
MKANNIVTFEHVSFSYEEDKTVLDDVSLQVAEGEWLAIVGHNGSGKSTMAKLINGLLVARTGEITVSGLPMTEENIWEIRRRVGMVFQNPDNQFVGATVQDDVAFGLENNGIPQTEMVTRVAQALADVAMNGFETFEPNRLSGGQKQRVAIAGVIALRPGLIILDEATSMLDPEGRVSVLATIKALKEQHQLTVISITHDLEEAAMADRVIVMNKGRYLMEGKPETIFKETTKLQEIGLDVPFVNQVQADLMTAGFKFNTVYFSEGELVNALCQLRSNK